MKLVNYLLGVLVVLAITVAIIIFTGNYLYAYLDSVSFLIVVLFPLPTMIGLFGWRNFWSCLGLAFRKETGNPEEYKHAAEVVRSLGRQIYLSSALGFFIGFIGMLSYFKANGTADQLAANFGVAFLVIFYGMLLNLILVEPIRAYLKSQS